MVQETNVKPGMAAAIRKRLVQVVFVVLLQVGLFVLRTALEGQTLQDELDGYKDYARRVRYRLLPSVWYEVRE